MGGISTLIQAAVKRRKEQRGARMKRRTARKASQKKIKEHRANKSLTKLAKRGLIRGERAFAKVDAKGNQGGTVAGSAAMTKYGKQQKKHADRKAKRDERKAARKAK